MTKRDVFILSFTQRRYLTRGQGSGVLAGGGTYVSLVDPATGDVTIVVETAGKAVGPFAAGNCNGQLNYGCVHAFDVLMIASSD
jgi:hypothetical protein